MVVVREQDVARGPQVRRPVLRLAVGAHDAVVAADAEVVLGRDATGVVQGLLSGEHHRTVGGHHQDALGVGEHGGFGVPVRLRADVDARDDDVDLTACLGEGDDATQAARDPVHVLGARFHGNRCTGGQCEPFDGCAELLGEVDGRDDSRALGLGDGAECLGRVAEQRDASDALGVLGRRCGGHADDDACGVAAVGTVDRCKHTVGVEVVLGERAAVAAQQRNQLVRVHGAARLGPLHLLGVLVERTHRLGRRRRHLGDDACTGSVRQAQCHFARGRAGLLGQARDEGDLLESCTDRQRRDVPGDGGDAVGGHVQYRPDIEHDAVGVESLLATSGLSAADAVEAGSDGALDLGYRDDVSGVVQLCCDATDLGECDESLVGWVGLGRQVEQVRPCAGGQTNSVEVLQSPQVESLTGQWVHVPDDRVLGEGFGSLDRGAAVGHLSGGGTEGGHGDSTPAAGARVRGQRSLELFREGVAVRRRVRPGQVEVHGQVLR